MRRALLLLGIALLAGSCALPLGPETACTPGVAADPYVTETADGAIVHVGRYAFCGGLDQHLAIRHVGSGKCWQVERGYGPFLITRSHPPQPFHGEEFKPSAGASYELIVHTVGDSHAVSARLPIPVR